MLLLACNNSDMAVRWGIQKFKSGLGFWEIVSLAKDLIIMCDGLFNPWRYMFRGFWSGLRISICVDVSVWRHDQITLRNDIGVWGILVMGLSMEGVTAWNIIYSGKKVRLCGRKREKTGKTIDSTKKLKNAERGKKVRLYGRKWKKIEKYQAGEKKNFKSMHEQSFQRDSYQKQVENRWRKSQKKGDVNKQKRKKKTIKKPLCVLVWSVWECEMLILLGVATGVWIIGVQVKSTIRTLSSDQLLPRIWAS